MVLLGAVGSYYNQGSIILLNGTNINHRNPSTITNEINPVIPDDWPGSDVDYYRQSYDNNYMGKIAMVCIRLSNRCCSYFPK